MSNKIIKKRVMEVIKQKIEVAQQGFDDGCKELDDQLEKDKETLADKKVEEIVGKFV